jgi:hypothetical protein
VNEIAREHRPAALDLLVGVVAANVATPDDVRPVVAQRLDQARRLWIVQQNDVARLHQGRELGGVLVETLLVDPLLALAKRRAVALGPVQRIVEALGDAEEIGRTLDDDPAGVDARAARIADE